MNKKDIAVIFGLGFMIAVLIDPIFTTPDIYISGMLEGFLLMAFAFYVFNLKKKPKGLKKYR